MTVAAAGPTGPTGRTGRRWTPLRLLVCGLIAAVLALTTMGYAIYATVTGGDPFLGAHPIETTATVDDSSSYLHHSSTVTVSYRSTDGTAETRTVETDDPSLPSPGDTVKVLYDRSDPSVVGLASDGTFGPVQLWATTGVLAPASTGLIIWSRRRRSR
jgi:hypothetical protein